MTISADMGVLAATGDGLLEQWRDLGPTLWLVTGVMAALWLAGLAVLAALHDPRKVRPGAAMLELQGSESPAVVNLLTTDWDLGHEAIPATLVDLAAKRYVDIDMVGDDTFVSVRKNRPAGSQELSRHESMVLRHVSGLASHTPEGRVPAEALTTGPEESAKRWWKDFRSDVVDEARGRGLSQARWSSGVKTVFILLALPIALAAALAASTLPDDPENPDDDPIGGAIACGIGTMVGASALVVSRKGERDTPAGREAAARWLGVRELLAEDPLFAEQPPAAVAIWDHLLAHGTALGVAHGVVQALPLGAESEREAWSSVGGRWRVVRVRYPNRMPPGYGTHPAIAVLWGLFALSIGLPMIWYFATMFRELVEGTQDEDGATLLGSELPRGVGTPLSIAGTAVTVLLVGFAVVGVWMILAGLADLVMGRTTVEGRVLRMRDRVRRDEDRRVTKVTRHIAVDDGTADKVRAWRFTRFTVGHRGDTVRGRVTRYLRHVRDLEVVGRPASSSAAVAEAARASTAPTIPGMPGTGAWGLGSPAGTSLAAAAMAAADALTAASGSRAGGGPGGPGAGEPGDRTAVPPTPPLPDDGTVSAAAGMALSRDPARPPTRRRWPADRRCTAPRARVTCRSCGCPRSPSTSTGGSRPPCVTSCPAWATRASAPGSAAGSWPGAATTW